MKKLVLSLALVALSPILFAQNELNFQTIDIVKNGDITVRNFTSATEDYIFLANSKLTKLNKQTKEYSSINTGTNNLDYSNLISDGSNHFFYNTNRNLLLKYIEEGQLDTIKTSFYLNKIFKIDENVSYILYSDSYNVTNPKLAKLTNGVFEDVLDLNTDSKIMGITIKDNKLVVLYENKISVANLSTNEVLHFPIDNMLYYGNQITDFKLDIIDSKLYYKSYENYQPFVKTFDLETYNIQETSLPNFTLGSFKKVGDSIIFIFNYNFYKINSDGTTSQIDLGNYSLNYNSSLDISYNNSVLTTVFSSQTGSYETIKIDILTGQIEQLSFLNYTTIFENHSIGSKQYYIKEGNLEVYDLSNGVREVLISNIVVQKILSVSNDEIIVHASTPETGAEIFAYNNLTSSLDYYGDLNHSPNSNPRVFTNVGNKVFYQALSPSGYDDLYVTQGTEDTTRKVFDVGLNNNSSGGLMKAMEFNNKLYFSGTRRSSNSGSELWFTDGTPEGTQEIEINPTTAGPYSDVSGFKSFIGKGQNRFYFIGYIPHQGSEIWTTNGTKEGTYILKDIAQGSQSPYLSTSSKAIVGDKLYFLQNIGGSLIKLWESDGTSNGTNSIADVFQLTNDGLLEKFQIITANDSAVYFETRVFNSDAYYSGAIIWRYDLETSAITKVDSMNLYYKISSSKNNIYYFKDSKFYRYNIINNEITLLESNIGNLYNELLLLEECGQYTLYGDTNFDMNFRGLRVWNNQTQTLEFTFDNSYSFLKDNSMCINNSPILYANNSLGTPNIPNTYFQIANGEINEIAIKVDDELVIPPNYLGQVVYNPQLNKVFGNSNFRYNGISELIVSDVDFQFLNMTEIFQNQNSNSNKNVIVYPNPATNELFITTKSAEILSFGIYDLTGKLMGTELTENQSEIKIEIKDLPKGIYIINVNTTKGKESKKLIIK